jgi:uncharacterized membrane protein
LTTGNTAEDRMRQAKRPATAALAGPYGHPLHPVLVTVPIGAWVASLCFDVGSHVADQAGTYAIGAYWLIALGLAGAVVAASVGVIDLAAIPTRTRAFRTALIHMTVMLGAVTLYAVSLALRHADIAAPRPGPTSSGLLALSVVALGVVGAGGWLGGKLSFRYGVRVADEAVQVDGYTDQEGR